MIRVITYLVITLVTMFASVSLYADNICKEKDSDGNVTFLDCDAANKSAKKVEIKDTTIVSPKEYLVDIPVAAKDKDISKQSDTQGSLLQAKKDLEEAKQVRTGDRQKTKTGSRLKESYFERVRQAEKRVEGLKNKK
ncbi:MAG: hypothetical protein COA46_08615 [Porticoccaceae bacterium]|nr:MAG: hypothetical protein COA46_08615 [Porticoccaceae bacterium]